MLYRSQSFPALLPFAIIVTTYNGSTKAPEREPGHLQEVFQLLIVVSAFKVGLLTYSDLYNSTLL